MELELHIDVGLMIDRHDCECFGVDSGSVGVGLSVARSERIDLFWPCTVFRTNFD